MKPVLYIDPECRLSKVPHRVPNNTHYVTLDQYQLMELQLKAEVERLEHQVRYWRIEAECDHGRWLRCLEDLEKLRNLK